ALRDFSSVSQERSENEKAPSGDHRQMTKLRVGLTLFAIVGIGATSRAQTLANRITSSPDRSVQFSYKARPGVCGDGRTYISTGSGNFYGYSNSSNEECQSGPVRVVLDLADRNVVALRTYVGAAALDQAVTDLGTVAPAEAADYL